MIALAMRLSSKVSDRATGHGVVVVDATQIDKSQTVPRTSSWHVSSGVLGRIVADIVERWTHLPTWNS